jgi:hypothetical protein
MFSLTPTQLRARRLRAGLAGYRGGSFSGGLIGRGLNGRGLNGRREGTLGLNSWRHRGVAALTVAPSKQPMLLEGLDLGVISFSAIAVEGAVDTPVEDFV